MTPEIKTLIACIGSSEKTASVKKLLAALGVKRLPPPKKETWKGIASTKPVTVLNGWTKVVAQEHGVTLELDFPEDRDGLTERPLSHKGPRSVTRIVLHAPFAGPIVLGWSMDVPLDVLRAEAKANGKAYARGPGRTPDSIRIGKVSYVIHRKKGNKLAERVELAP